MKAKWFMGAALMALAIAGCGDKGGETSTTGGTTENGGGNNYTIAVIPKGATHEFWNSVKAGAEEAGKELGVTINWKAPAKEDDRESQIKIVEDMITAQVNGIVLAPLDDVALATPVTNAKNSGIPVVIIDSGLKSEDFVSFVATDNYKGGQMAGEHMAELLGGKGKVIMLRYQEGSASTMEREKGFMDAIAKHPEIQVVSENQYAGATLDTAQTASESLLQTFRNSDGGLSIDGIYTPNESSTHGMLLVLTGNNWAGKVKFVGFDASAELVKGMEDGFINGLIVQNPRKMGYEGVKTIVAHLNKQEVEKRVDTGATLVTPENMTNEDIKSLISPP